MDKEPITISDNTQRIKNHRIDIELERLAAEKLHDAEQRETELLNRAGISDLFIACAYFISNKIHNRHKTK